MKGLLKNNFYAVRSSAKVFSAFMFLLGVFVIVVVSLVKLARGYYNNFLN